MERKLKFPAVCTTPFPPEHPYDMDDSPRPRMELPPLCHSGDFPSPGTLDNSLKQLLLQKGSFLNLEKWFHP